MMSPSSSELLDLFIIGGGINGVGIARDAAGRGLKVALCEDGDLGGATSSASSKLVHGGLRYLEHYEFRLVREALAERETLLAIAPHIVHPMRFVMPHVPELRPAWVIRAGLFLYDHLGKRVSLPGSRGVNLASDPLGRGLKPGFRRGFVYSDCWVDDARLVVLNARDAADLGACILTHTRFESAAPAKGSWRISLQDVRRGERRQLSAKVLVNAAGPWVGTSLNSVPGVHRRHDIRLVKGSHIVVPRIHDGEHALILQNDDNRVVFVIPYEGDYSLIGTTDVAVSGDPEAAGIDDDEMHYLCRAVNRYLEKPVTPDEVIGTFTGVRPLFDDGEMDPSKLSRDYALEMESASDDPPILSVYGGKLTTYRRLAERALERLAPWFESLAPPWTATRPLPGGELPRGGMDALLGDLSSRYPGLDALTLSRLARRHGGLCDEVLGGEAGDADLGEQFAADLYAHEVDYLVRREWAQNVEDVLWRRTKVGLRVDSTARARLGKYLEQLVGEQSQTDGGIRLA